ncbi:hypothetical protein C5B27_12005, partial [Neisseria gonorrhoeae]
CTRVAGVRCRMEKGRPLRSSHGRSSAATDVYKGQRCRWQIGYNRRIFSLSDGIAAVRTFL